MKECCEKTEEDIFDRLRKAFLTNAEDAQQALSSLDIDPKIIDYSYDLKEGLINAALAPEGTAPAGEIADDVAPVPGQHKNDDPDIEALRARVRKKIHAYYASTIVDMPDFESPPEMPAQDTE